MGRINVSEEKVRALGDPKQIEAHYSDEVTVNHLFAMADEAQSVARTWAKMPPREKGEFLGQMQQFVADGDALGEKGALSPLLKDERAKAKAEWSAGKELLKNLR